MSQSGTKPVDERQYFVTSLQTSGDALLQLIRECWSIEGSWHWVRNVIFGEDRHRMNWPHPVWNSWRLHQSPNGVWEKHHWLSTRPLSVSGINVWAACRWQIEGFFRGIKQRFSLGQCRQQYIRGLCTWLLLVWVAYLFFYWVALVTQTQAEWPDWMAAATIMIRVLFLPLLLTWLERRRRELEQWSFSHPILDIPLRSSLCILS